MAERLDSSDCLLCSEELKDPVTLGCDHCFCFKCLQEQWAPNRTGDCPKCRRRFSKELPLFFALKEKRESTLRQTESSEEQTRGEEEEVRRKLSEDISFVSDKPKVSSQTQASEEELQSEIQRLVQKKKHSENIRKEYEDMLQHTERQKQHCEDQISEEFDQLRLILYEEEKLHLLRLKQEQKVTTLRIQQKLRDTEAKLASLSDRIKSAEQQLQSQSSAPLTEIRDPLVLAEEPDPPAPEPGLLLDEARVLKDLRDSVYSMKEMMMEMIKPSPEFLLDPNTAHRNLRLSEDLTRVRHTETSDPNVPLNPERFRSYTSVLGSEGFSYGRWRWCVEVGDHPEWTIGLVKESVDRTAELKTLPENGFWCLKHHENKYYDVTGETVTLSRRPDTIRVDLDYETGRVSFYDSVNLICSHTGPLREKLFPYFYVGPKGGAKEIKIRQINCEMPLESSLSSLQLMTSVPPSSSSQLSFKPEHSYLRPEQKTAPESSRGKEESQTWHHLFKMPLFPVEFYEGPEQETAPESSEKPEEKSSE